MKPAEPTVEPAERLQGWLDDLEALEPKLNLLLADDQVAWSFRAVAMLNEPLRQSDGLFLDLFWFGYLYRTMLSLRAATDRQRSTHSYRRLLEDLHRHHQALGQLIPRVRLPSKRHLRDWIDELGATVRPVRDYANQVVAHWGRAGADEIEYLQVRRAVYETFRTHQRLRFVLTGDHLRLPWVDDRWMETLRIPFWPPEADPVALQEALAEAPLTEAARAQGWPEGYWPPD